MYDSFEKSIVAVKAALRFPTRLGTKWPAQPPRIRIITREGLLQSGLDPDMLLPNGTFNSAYRAAQTARGRRVWEGAAPNPTPSPFLNFNQELCIFLTKYPEDWPLS